MNNILSYDDVKAAAASVGFHACGMAAARRLPDFDRRLSGWLDAGGHAAMGYMADHREMRGDPTLLLPGAKSVISVLLGYKPSSTMKGPNKIAQYAYGDDYHDRVKAMLHAMVALLREQYLDFEAKPCVDTVPISDKMWAFEAGLGWIGKNTLLVNPRMGSYCFVGELVTTWAVDHYDSPMVSQCGDCDLCLKACPNGALKCELAGDEKEYYLQSTLCTSYNTIENRSEQLPEHLHRAGYVYGCDCCQLACPYNRQAQPVMEIAEERMGQLEALSAADETTFRRVTKRSAMNRIKYWQWKRNNG